MPEGPIIVILKEELKPFKHQRVIAAKGYTPKMDPHLIIGQTLKNIKSWGKHLLLCFDDFTVRVHLGLFGSYRINSRGKKNASLNITFETGEVNFYISSIELIDKPLNQVYDWSADVMSKKWDTEKAIARLKMKPKALAGDVLLDQKIFSGVGNIIRNEALFRARIHPDSIIANIPDEKLHELIDETIKYTFDFLKWKKKGVLTKHFEAYEQEMCPRDHIPFHKADLGKTKRHTFYCDVCEKLYVS
ncbi:DNA-formamidopyrimidine glycosylase family protein [Mucilaginibacter sp.]